MSYEEFTLEQITSDFGLTIEENVDLFAATRGVQLDEYFLRYLHNNIPLAIAISTEKAKSEMIVAPILIELRRMLNNQISLFSGVKFNVDNTKGLNGFCDFLVSRDRQQSFINAIYIDWSDYYIINPEKIMGILMSTVKLESTTSGQEA